MSHRNIGLSEIGQYINEGFYSVAGEKAVFSRKLGAAINSWCNVACSRPPKRRRSLIQCGSATSLCDFDDRALRGKFGCWALFGLITFLHARCIRHEDLLPQICPQIRHRSRNF